MSRKRQKKTLFLMDGDDSPTNKISNLLTSKLNHIKLLHSDKGAYFYKYSKLGLVIPACALLLVLDVIIGSGKAYAIAPDPNFSVTLSMTGTVKEEQELEAGVVGYLENTFKVTTKAAASYSLYLTSADGYTDKLVGEKYQKEINGVGNNVTSGNFAQNTWGYSLSGKNQSSLASTSMVYSTIPDGSAPIMTVSNPGNANDSYKIVFAARIGDDMPADHYKSQVVLSVVASPKDAQAFNGITKMQEMTQDICTNYVDIGDEKQLIDTRDNKKYWVARLSDGNCWMTQNLDLDIPAEGLKADDTDILSDWIVSAEEVTIPSTVTLSTENWPDTNDIIRSYDPGMYMYNATNGASSTACVSSSSGLKDCESSQWKLLTSDSGINAHRLIGNYYSFNAALAGAATGRSSYINGSSICPKGWRIPTYGSAWSIESGNDSTYSAPYYLTYGGYVASGQITSAGSVGYYWVSASGDKNNAYIRYISSKGTSGNSYLTNRAYGISVRCVAK